MTIFREPTREWLERLETLIADFEAGGGYSVADVDVHLLKDYIPGDPGGTLTNSNFCAALQAAVDALAPAGGTLVIPAGTWAPSTPDFATITITGSGYTTGSLRIIGAGLWRTVFYMPNGWSGDQILLDGYPTAITNCFIQGMTLGYATPDVSNDGCAIHMRGMVGGGLIDLTMPNGDSGKAVKCTYPAPGHNSQYVAMRNVTPTGWDVSYDLDSLSVAYAESVNSSASGTADFILNNVGGNFRSCAIQSDASDAMIVMEGDGGSSLTFTDLYSEGTVAKFLRMDTPGVTGNTLAIVGGRINTAMTEFASVTSAYNYLTIQNLTGVNNATTILSATGAPRVYLSDTYTPESHPGKFSLDGASSESLVCVNTIDASARFGGGVQLVEYATGSEPTRPVGTILASSSHEAPIYCTAADVWKRVVLEGEADDLHALLWPYATDMWDAKHEALHLTPTVDMQGWKGNTMTYNVGNALTRDTGMDVNYPTGRLRPTAATKYATCTIGSPVGNAGESVGAVVVAAMPVAGGVGSNCVFGLANATFTRELRLAVDDGNIGGRWYCYAVGSGGAAFAHSAGTAVQLATPTVLYAMHEGITVTFRVNGVEVTTTAAGATTADLDKVSIMACNPTAWTGCTSTPNVSFCAYLHTPLPASITARMYAILRRDYNVRIDPT